MTFIALIITCIATVICGSLGIKLLIDGLDAAGFFNIGVSGFGLAFVIINIIQLLKS